MNLMHRATLLALALLVPASVALARGARALTIDDLYDPDKQLALGENYAKDLAWISDDAYAQPSTDPKTKEVAWLEVDAASGRSAPLFAAAKLEAALRAVPGAHPAVARSASRSKEITFTKDHRRGLLTFLDDLFAFDTATGALVRLTEASGAEEVAEWSPDGAKVAFVRGGNLYVVDVATRHERALTTDGSAERLNGKLDWVYQEEIYGRGKFRAFWWSPDSRRIAFLQLDESGVPKHPIPDPLAGAIGMTIEAYPRAGDPNPRARLAVVAVEVGSPAFVPWTDYEKEETLIVAVGFTPDSSAVAFNVQNREQTWLDLRLARSDGLSSRRVLRETTPAWVDNLGLPHWLRDGTFLWLSEAKGWSHILRYRADGTLIGSVTSGAWDVRALHGVDEKSGLVYFSGTARSPIGIDVYRIKLDGSRLTLLSSVEGAHKAAFNPSLTRYIDTWSNVTTPHQVRLHRAGGKEERVIDANPVPALTEMALAKPEFLRLRTRDGQTMQALMLRPPNFDATRKYPVLQHVYAGPGAPSVKNEWGGKTSLFEHLLAQRGVIAWRCDNRSASNNGASSRWPIHKRLGEQELQDVEDGLTWLKSLAYVDPARIGIEGWSYGGYITSYALTHSRSFAMGIAAGPVTDWRNYDSIYTERYMGLPSANPEGYRRSSVREAAGGLSGRLLLVHGAIDDNVHLENTFQLAHSLQTAGRPFDLMVYPKERHTFKSPVLIKHVRATMLRFIEETLLRELPIIEGSR